MQKVRQDGGCDSRADSSKTSAVLRQRRRHRLGRALTSAVAAHLLLSGAELVWLGCEAGGLTERFFAGLGFEPAYDSVTFTCSAQTEMGQQVRTADRLVRG